MIIFHIEAWRVRRTCVGLSTVESWNCGLQWLRVVTTPGARWRRSPARVVQSNKRRKATTVESIGHCSGSSEERDRHSRWFIAGIIPLPAIRLHTATRTILIPPPPPLPPLSTFHSSIFLIHRLLPDQLINRCWNAAEIELSECYVSFDFTIVDRSPSWNCQRNWNWIRRELRGNCAGKKGEIFRRQRNQIIEKLGRIEGSWNCVISKDNASFEMSEPGIVELSMLRN